MPRIRIENGPEAGRVIPVASERLVIGRFEGADIHVEDTGVSREHAEVFRIGELVFVKDLGSRNGTFLGDAAVGEDLLQDGDRIRVGSTLLVFEDSRSAQEPGDASGTEDAGEEDSARKSLEASLRCVVDRLFEPDTASLFVARRAPPSFEAAVTWRREGFAGAAAARPEFAERVLRTGKGFLETSGEESVLCAPCAVGRERPNAVLALLRGVEGGGGEGRAFGSKDLAEAIRLGPLVALALAAVPDVTEPAHPIRRER